MRAVVRGLLLCLISTVLVGCDPTGPSSPGSARLWITLTPEGDAYVEVQLPAGDSPSSRSTLGAQLGADLFPDAERRHVWLDRQNGTLRVDVDSVYAAGSHPSVHLALGSAVRTLHEHGLGSIDVGVTAPAVPSAAKWSEPPTSSSSGDWFWRGLKDGQAPPSGQVQLRPEPLRAVGELALVALIAACLMSGALAARKRHRTRCVLLGCAAIIASGVAVFTAGAVQGDNLGVAGILSGMPLKLATELPIAALAGLPLGIALIVYALASTRPASIPVHQGR